MAEDTSLANEMFRDWLRLYVFGLASISVLGNIGLMSTIPVQVQNHTASPSYVLPTLEVLAHELWPKSEKGAAVAEAATILEE